MIRFEWLDADPAPVAAALEAPLARGLAQLASVQESLLRAQESPLRDAFGDLDWRELQPSEAVPWYEFATSRALFEERLRPRRGVAASFLRPQRPVPLLAIFDFEDGATRLAGIRTGQGVIAAQKALERIRKTLRANEDIRAALATESEHAAFGWVLSLGPGRRRFWPIFPERYGFAKGVSLSAEQWFDVL